MYWLVLKTDSCHDIDRTGLSSQNGYERVILYSSGGLRTVVLSADLLSYFSSFDVSFKMNLISDIYTQTGIDPVYTYAFFPKTHSLHYPKCRAYCVPKKNPPHPYVRPNQIYKPALALPNATSYYWEDWLMYVAVHAFPNEEGGANGQSWCYLPTPCSIISLACSMTPLLGKGSISNCQASFI